MVLTEFDEDGIELSGGQKQSLALLRLITSSSPFIILDEPTSSLDIRREEYFYKLIEDNLKDKTIIFTSHRLASVKLCDKILFMDEGKIVESGTHEELIKYDGLYAHMYSKQEEMYTML